MGTFSEGRVVGGGSKIFVSDRIQFQASANEFTVESWIKMATLPSNGIWQTIVAKSFSASSGVSYILQIGKNAIDSYCTLN